jgi:hypothetical protein
VIVAELYFVGIPIRPAKADPPLVIDANAVLVGAVARKRFEPVSRRHAEIVHIARGVDEQELVPSPFRDIRRDAFRDVSGEDCCGAFIGEALDHGKTVTPIVTNTKRN